MFSDLLVSILARQRRGQGQRRPARETFQLLKAFLLTCHRMRGRVLRLEGDWYSLGLLGLGSSDGFGQLCDFERGTFTSPSAMVLLYKNALEGVLVKFQGLSQLSHSSCL